MSLSWNLGSIGSKVLRAAITIYQATPAVKLKSFQSCTSTMDKKHYQADAGGGGGEAGVTWHLPPSNNLIVSRTCSLKLTMCDISTVCLIILYLKNIYRVPHRKDFL